MLELQHDIIKHLQSNQPGDYVSNILALKLADPNEVLNTLRDLSRLRLVKITNDWLFVYITKEGVKAFLQSTEERNERAEQYSKQAAEKRAEATQENNNSKKQFRQNLIATLIGSAATLFIEHFSDIIEWFLSFFR